MFDPAATSIAITTSNFSGAVSYGATFVFQSLVRCEAKALNVDREKHTCFDQV